MEKLPHQMDENLVMVQILLKFNKNDYALGFAFWNEASSEVWCTGISHDEPADP